jgi:TolA-binding protein
MGRLLGWGLLLGAFLGGCTASRTVIVHERTAPPPVEARTPGLGNASRVHTRNGIRFYERGHYRKAIQQFELALAKDPSNWEAHFYLGECYRELRDWDRCLSHYHRVRDLRPGERVWVAKVEFSIGLVHERRGHLAKAHEHYDLALLPRNTGMTTARAARENVTITKTKRQKTKPKAPRKGRFFLLRNQRFPRRPGFSPARH